MNRHSKKQKGITTIELMVSAAVLLGIMTFVGSLTVRINGVWKDIVQRRVAVCELTNQLEELTRQDEKELDQQLDSLEPSIHCSNSLRGAKLSATVRDDQLGKRIVLSINWSRTHAGKPVELSGWLTDFKKTENDDATGEEVRDDE